MNMSISSLIHESFLQKSFIKSPLNYTGGKFKLLSQKEYDSLIKDEKLIIDVKGIVPEPSWKL